MGTNIKCVCIERYRTFKLNGEKGIHRGEQRLEGGEGVSHVGMLLEGKLTR